MIGLKRGAILLGVLTTILTARLGKISYDGHYETYYNLPMGRIVERADETFGVSGIYEEREDGVKTYNGFVIVAADWDIHPYGSVVNTSRGKGIVLDTHTDKDRNIVDLAVCWE